MAGPNLQKFQCSAQISNHTAVVMQDATPTNLGSPRAGLPACGWPASGQNKQLHLEVGSSNPYSQSVNMQCRMFFYLQYNTTTLHLLNSIEQRGEQHATHEDIYCQFFVCAVPSYMYTGAFFQVWAGDLRLPVCRWFISWTNKYWCSLPVLLSSLSSHCKRTYLQ